VIVIPPVVKSAEEIAKEIKQKKLDEAMEIVVPFVSPMTLKNYTERKIQDQIDDLVSKALVDTRMRAQGRA
jgi:ribosomal protein L22